MPRFSRGSRGRSLLVLLPVGIAGAWLAWTSFRPGARPDRSYRPAVERPAFPAPGPLALFDEGHRNVHRLRGNFGPFARLLAADGVEVRPLRGPLTPDALAGARLLVLVNAKGPDGADHESAYSSAEIAAVADWVRAGGGLLLVADHTPFGSAASALAGAFGVGMLDGEVRDERHRDPGASDPAQLRFAAAEGLLLEHPILAGRGAEERVERVVTFTGQALAAPPGAARLLRLSDSATDLPVLRVELREGFLDWDRITTFGDLVPTRGDCQALALDRGEGRVVVAGEAALFTAQVARGERFGLAWPGADNERFVRNVVRWLGRAL